MALRTISAANAGLLDKELMGSGGFSLDQLMELAGLSVSQALYRLHPPSRGRRVLVACGPGNNGGDGLVAARHLRHYGYRPSVYYPRPGQGELFARLAAQLRQLAVPFVDDDFSAALAASDCVVDALFGFSYAGPLRAPFAAAVAGLRDAPVPVLAVDAPSSWHIDAGPPDDEPGRGYCPAALVSLTAPKPLAAHFRGRHFIGGRFLSAAMAEKYNLDLPHYEGVDQIAEISVQNGTG